MLALATLPLVACGGERPALPVATVETKVEDHDVTIAVFQPILHGPMVVSDSISTPSMHEDHDVGATAQAVLDPRVRAVTALLHGKPLEAHALELVAVSDELGIDWRLLPVIAVLESSGGEHACGGNAWGWGSCRLRPIETFGEGMRVAGATLAGPPYEGETPETQLCIWVSGHGCTTEHAAAYAAKGMALWEGLAIP